ncbi:MAG: outer membrane protein assembly factor BamD [Candidatus Omnitrophica bacterium]|nr:outer membrane protein assembly factor BamD [Candidatus Omnitrophota bacterium]
MQTKRSLCLIAILVLTVFVSPAQAYWIWSPAEGKFVTVDFTETQRGAKQAVNEQFEAALKLQETGGGEEGIKELKRLVQQYPDSAYAPEAQYLIAISYEKQEKPIQAAQEFQKLIRDFPRTQRVDQATEHLFTIGNLFLTGQKQKLLGVSIIPVLSKAADIFKFIIEQAPYGPYGDQAQLRLGIAYRKMGNYDEAVQAFQAVIENYPTSALLDEVHYQLAETSYEFSQNASRDQRTLTQAGTYLKEFIKQYSTSTLAERARILKQQLDDQDAEKNYQIGLYYEKEGFIESAMIYYEDVANRYPEATFGKKAADRFQALNSPALAMAKGEGAIQQRLAEVRSMLEAMDKEEQKKSAAGQALPETGQIREQLEAEFTSLTMTQKRFQEDTREKFDSRFQALREREKNLRDKLKTLSNRKKQMQDNPSPELEMVFQKWEVSLFQEQQELARERATLESLGLKFQAGWSRWFNWVPFVGAPGLPSGDRLIEYKEEKWEKLEQERAELSEKREAEEKALDAIDVEIQTLNQKEFEIAKTLPLFQELLPQDLKQQGALLDQKRFQWNESVQAFEQAKKEYETHYGNEFLKTLTLQSRDRDSRLKSVQQLISSGANLEETLASLQKQKSDLGELWLARKERLNTMASAFQATQEKQPIPTQEAVDSSAPFTGESRAQEIRLFRKRIKYVEREIRTRMDQIQDWQRENAKRIDELERLLHADKSDAASKVLTPIAGTYKLAKAFVFGLPHRERELVEEADENLKQGQVAGLTSKQLDDVRELKEEIELQSILIQGRAEEISELNGRLDELEKQARIIPGFAYQSLLVERIPADLDYSVTSARELLGGEREEIFAERINRETLELKKMEEELKNLDQKISDVSQAMEPSQPSSPTVPTVLPFIGGDAETMPTPAQIDPSDEERKQMESKLLGMKSELDQAGAQYEAEVSAYDQTVLTWYQTEAREQLTAVFPAEGIAVIEQEKSLGIQREETEKSLVELKHQEREAARSQMAFLDRKLGVLEKRFSRLKGTSEPGYRVLRDEIDQLGTKRNTLIREISYLETNLQR